jgi:hypothetical protein
MSRKQHEPEPEPELTFWQAWRSLNWQQRGEALDAFAAHARETFSLAEFWQSPAWRAFKATVVFSSGVALGVFVAYVLPDSARCWRLERQQAATRALAATIPAQTVDTDPRCELGADNALPHLDWNAWRHDVRALSGRKIN